MLADAGAYNILITRLDAEKAAGGLQGDSRGLRSRLANRPWPRPAEIERVGSVAVATGGTSDMPVAEEAALTAEALGNQVVRLYDVGVAGLHRLLAQLDELHERPRGHRHRRHGGRAGQRASADW